MAAAQPPAATPSRRRGATLAIAALVTCTLIALLGALVISGHRPEYRGLVSFASTKGVVASAPADVRRVEMRTGPESVTLSRNAGGWVIEGEGGATAVPAEMASHIEVALRFLHVSEPSREIGAAELTAASFAEYGLDPPASVVELDAADGKATTVNFGILNPTNTSQYLRLAGAGTVYLVPRHVGAEWQVVGDMARRLRPQATPGIARRGKSLLLPVSLAEVWAVEIVAGGKLTRFERDSAGNWLRHVGGHLHAANTTAHVADPVQAGIIGTALDAFDETAIETQVAHSPGQNELARYGLNLPSLIVMFYARDSSVPLARVELGASADSLDRYARLAPDGDVVTVAEFEVRRLSELLKAVGAGS